MHGRYDQLLRCTLSFRNGSKPEFTAPQQQRPLHLNERTCRGKL
jgi:hypothetical protein